MNAVEPAFNRGRGFPTLVGMKTDTTEAARHFAAKLRFETDPSDVKAAMDAAERFVLVDTRGEAAWRQGRVEGAIHLPTADIERRAAELIPADLPVVVYCWGPGCNGSTRAALAFSLLGYEVREMIGGFEYWAREGLPVVADDGPVTRAADPLTAPLGSIVCDC
jgi:rhodanese-related sulfurtransferase